MRRAFASLLHVRDGRIPIPSQTGVQIADSHRRRAADSGSAMEIDSVAFGEQFAQGLNGGIKLGPKFDLFFDHGNAAKKDRASFVVGFERRKIQVDGAHVVVGVDIQHGADACFAAEAFDIVNCAGMRADKQPRKNLRVG